MKCLLSGNNNFIKIFSVKKVGIYMRTEKRKNHSPIKRNINYFINKNTGTVQINPKIDVKLLYKKSHGSGTIGNTWFLHHKKFYNLVKKYLKGNILEIGGGDNSMLNQNIKFNKINNFFSLGKNINLKKKNKKIHIINSLFTKKLLHKKNIRNLDLVIHSHLFEHLYKPNNFLQVLHKNMTTNSYQVFSMPNMYQMLKSGMANAVFFEHPFYYDEKATKLLLSRNGFKIIRKTYFGKRHSVMYVTKKINRFNKIRYNCYKKNKKIFSNLKNKWSKDLKKIKELAQGNKKIFLFGANIFSQIILSKNTDKKILGIIDNDKNKQNQFLYGTKIKVFSPHILKKVQKPYLYLRAGDYNNEIKKQIKSINKECSFF